MSKEACSFSLEAPYHRPNAVVSSRWHQPSLALRPSRGATEPGLRLRGNERTDIVIQHCFVQRRHLGRVTGHCIDAHFALAN